MSSCICHMIRSVKRFDVDRFFIKTVREVLGICILRIRNHVSIFCGVILHRTEGIERAAATTRVGMSRILHFKSLRYSNAWLSFHVQDTIVSDINICALWMRLVSFAKWCSAIFAARVSSVWYKVIYSMIMLESRKGMKAQLLVSACAKHSSFTVLSFHYLSWEGALIFCWCCVAVQCVPSCI